MRRWTPALAVAVLAIGSATPVLAQDEGPTYTEVTSLDFAPADIDAFLDAVKTVRDAAVEVGLDASFAWDMYRWDNTLFFLTWHDSMVDFEDPEAFARAFQGTPAESRVMAAFQATTGLHINEGMNEVSLARPDLSYMPAEPAVERGQQGGVYVMRQWPNGDAEAYGESIKDFMGMLTEMGAPYPVFVSQNVIGRGGFMIAVPFDNLSNFYGANSLEEGLTASGMGARWGEHEREHRQLISDTESRIVMYLPDHSYRPEGM